jgi:hypothetical protein
MLGTGWGLDPFRLVERYPLALLVIFVTGENVIIRECCGLFVVLVLAPMDKYLPWREFG